MSVLQMATQRLVSGPLRASRSRPRTADRDPDRAGGAGVRGHVLRPPPDPILGRPRTRASDQDQRPVLGAAMEGVPAATGRCRAARTKAGRDLERDRMLQADISVLDEEIKILLAGTDGQILTSLPGVAATGWPHSRPLACPLPGSPTPSTSTPPPAWRRRCRSRRPCASAAGSHGKGCRVLRRAHGHRLGAVAVLTLVRRAQRRTPLARHGTHPGSRRPGPQRLPSDLPPARDLTTLR